MHSGQSLINETNIHLYLIKGDLSKAGKQTKTFEINSAGTGIKLSSDIDSLTLPTSLSEENWEEALEKEIDPDGNIESIETVGDKIKINLKDKSYTVRCSVIGIGFQPNADPFQSEQDLEDSDNNALLNPAGNNDIVLTNSDAKKDNTACGGGRACNVTMTFDNRRGGDVDLEKARILFYNTQPSNKMPQTADFMHNNIEIFTGDYTDIDEILESGDNTVWARFFNNGDAHDVKPGENFFLSIKYNDDGQKINSTYVVQPEEN